MSEVQAQKASWPTLGKYVKDKQPGGVTTPHQDFLLTFAYGRWREYSAMAHGAFEGLMLVARYYIADAMPHELRENMHAQHPEVLALHLARAAGVLLCIVTELQAYFHFDNDGARINERISTMWNTLIPVPEIKELYDEHYAQLMKDQRIMP